MTLPSEHDIILDGWNLTQAMADDVGAIAPKVQAPVVKKPTKMSRATRVALHLSLNDAVGSKKLEKVRELLDEGAPIDLTESSRGVDIMATAVRKFDKSIFDVLVEHGANFVPHAHVSIIFKSEDTAALEHFLSTQGSWPLGEPGQHSYKVMEGLDAGKPPKMGLWESGYTILHHGAPTPKSLAMLNMLEEAFPRLINIIPPHPNKSTWGKAILGMLIDPAPGRSARFATQVSIMQVWAQGFTSMFRHLLTDSSDMNAQALTTLNTLLTTHPHVRTAWEQSCATMSKIHTDWAAFFAPGPDGQSHADRWFQAPLDTHTQNELRHLRIDDLLGRPRALIAQSTPQLRALMQEKFDRSTMFDRMLHRSKGPYDAYPGCPKTFSPPTFLSLLTHTAAPALTTIIQTPDGRAAIEAALSDDLTAHSFARSATVPVFTSVIRAIPSLTAWRDSYGNSLAHHRVHNQNGTRALADLLTGLDPSWCAQANAAGNTVRDLFAHEDVGGASAEVVAHLDSRIMNKVVRQDADVAKKTRAPLAKSAHRKM